MKRRHAHKTNVLLVNITRLGDMLQATPTIAGMRMENPDCKVSVVVEKQFEGVCKIIPGIDEVVSVDLGMTVRALAREGEGILDAYEYVDQFVTDLRSKKYDYCLNMSSSPYTAMLLNLLGIKRNGGWSSDDEGFRVIESEWARLFASSVFHQNRQYNSLNLVDVFRCSADVEQHPHKLVLTPPESDLVYVDQMLAEAGFTNQGPLVAVQAGASQGKRQWSPQNFISFINCLVNNYGCRVVLTGTQKEMPIIDPIVKGCNSPNVLVAAGKTNIPQLAALLKRCQVCVTGDTGTMHISVAVATPVVAVFLASAFGFETGPYSEGNIVLQPVIGCGPCNPNKPCARPDCHQHIDPEVLARIAAQRCQGDIRALPTEWFDPSKIIVYRTQFDQFGFYDMQAISSNVADPLRRYRQAYRKLWLDDLGGFPQDVQSISHAKQSLVVVPTELEGLTQVIQAAEQGARHITQLVSLVKDVNSSPKLLGQVNDQLSGLDREIEQMGFHYPHLGPLTRMFVFGKENISGADALGLASQMLGVYKDLGTRAHKLSAYYY